MVPFLRRLTYPDKHNLTPVTSCQRSCCMSVIHSDYRTDELQQNAAKSFPSSKSMKLSCNHAANFHVSSVCRDVTSRGKRRRSLEERQQQAWKCRSELRLEVCVMRTGPSLFRAPGLWSAQPALRHASDPRPLSLTPMFLLCLFVFG